MDSSVIEGRSLALRVANRSIYPLWALLLAGLAMLARVRQLRPQVLVFARAHFQKCHYNSASCSGAAGFSIPNA